MEKDFQDMIPEKDMKEMDLEFDLQKEIDELSAEEPAEAIATETPEPVEAAPTLEAEEEAVIPAVEAEQEAATPDQKEETIPEAQEGFAFEMPLEKPLMEVKETALPLSQEEASAPALELEESEAAPAAPAKAKKDIKPLLCKLSGWINQGFALIVSIVSFILFAVGAASLFDTPMSFGYLGQFINASDLPVLNKVLGWIGYIAWFLLLAYNVYFIYQLAKMFITNLLKKPVKNVLKSTAKVLENAGGYMAACNICLLLTAEVVSHGGLPALAKPVLVLNLIAWIINALTKAFFWGCCEGTAYKIDIKQSIFRTVVTGLKIAIVVIAIELFLRPGMIDFNIMRAGYGIGGGFIILLVIIRLFYVGVALYFVWSVFSFRKWVTPIVLLSIIFVLRFIETMMCSSASFAVPLLEVLPGVFIAAAMGVLNKYCKPELAITDYEDAPEQGKLL